MPSALEHESLATFLGNHLLLIIIIVLAVLWVLEEAADAVRGDKDDA